MTRIAYIIWRDANFGNGADTPMDQIGGLVELHEVGFVLKETPEAVTLSMESGLSDLSNRAFLTIPRVNIVSIRFATVEKVFPPRKKR